jgi:hypothetical protein
VILTHTPKSKHACPSMSLGLSSLLVLTKTRLCRYSFFSTLATLHVVANRLWFDTVRRLITGGHPLLNFQFPCDEISLLWIDKCVQNAARHFVWYVLLCRIKTCPCSMIERVEGFVRVNAATMLVMWT